jgi:FKBP-type peptidyl-prolyl cis-trans isomerase
MKLLPVTLNSLLTYTKPHPRKQHMFPLANSLRATTRILATRTSTSPRYFSSTAAAMGVTKQINQEGSGPTPKVGDKVTIEYTGFLKDTSKPDHKGNQYALPPLLASQTIPHN